MIGHVYINGQIGNDYDENGVIITKGVELIDVISQVASNGEVEQTNVHIDSQGGYVTVGREIAEFIASLDNCFTIAENLCASIATEIHLSVPLQNRSIQAGTDYIIHNPFIPSVGGDASALQAYADSVKEDENKMVAMYSKATGLSKEAIAGLMKIETNLTVEQCISLKFASSIVAKIQERAVALIYNQKQVEMSKPLMERIALAMQVLKGEDVQALTLETDKGVIETPYEDLVIGDPVMFTDGSIATDETYTAVDGTVIVVVDGVIESFTQLEVEPTEIEASLRAEIEGLKAELLSANEVAETVVAKFEELAKQGSTFVPIKAETTFRKIEVAEKSVKEQMQERKLNYKNK